MIQAAKIIGTGLATTGLIGAGVGIGVVFGALILGVATTGLSGTVIAIIIFIFLIGLMYDLYLRASFNLQFVILGILIVLLSTLGFVLLDFLFTSAFHFISYVEALHQVYVASRYLCMALPSNSEDVFKARAQDRINNILLGKICQKYNVPLDLKIYIHDYFRYYYLERFNKKNRI